jgi:hypothetical protein
MSEAKEHVRAIRDAIKARRDEIFAAHPWLAHQDAIGAFLALSSFGGCVALWVAYAWDALPAWAVVLGVAWLGSILHELEHDLMHELYFKSSPRLRDVLVLLCWLPRPNILNPWARKVAHLHHHRVSGTRTDYEEIATTNGLPWGMRRFLMMTCRTVRVWITGRRSKPITIDGVTLHRRWFDGLETLFDSALFGWLASLVVRLFVPSEALPAGVALVVRGLDFVAVALVIPNLWRRFCLFFMTSNCHYHGDVAGLLQQTQVLNHWVFLPFNLFCFNFGATHAIHHFVVRQPFYIRQWVAPVAYRAFRDHGVRSNDLGTFRRANRYAEAV